VSLPGRCGDSSSRAEDLDRSLSDRLFALDRERPPAGVQCRWGANRGARSLSGGPEVSCPRSAGSPWSCSGTQPDGHDFAWPWQGRTESHIARAEGELRPERLHDLSRLTANPARFGVTDIDLRPRGGEIDRTVEHLIIQAAAELPRLGPGSEGERVRAAASGGESQGRGSTDARSGVSADSRAIT